MKKGAYAGKTACATATQLSALRGRRFRLPLLLVTLFMPAFAQRPVSPCATCHAAQAIPQLATPMAHAAESIAECGVLRSHPLLQSKLGNYNYKIERQGSESLYTVSDATGSLSLPIKYAFGLGEAGQTYILEKDGQLYESFVSYYQALDGLDITIGDQPLHPAQLDRSSRTPHRQTRNSDLFHVPHHQRY